MNMRYECSFQFQKFKKKIGFVFFKTQLLARERERERERGEILIYIYITYLVLIVDNIWVVGSCRERIARNRNDLEKTIDVDGG